MIGTLLFRGMLVGVLARLLTFGFARIFGEPQVDRAIAFEEQMSQARSELPEPELVSRETQAGLGLFTGVIVYSATSNIRQIRLRSEILRLRGYHKRALGPSAFLATRSGWRLCDLE
jgi:hypothetical protein